MLLCRVSSERCSPLSPVRSRNSRVLNWKHLPLLADFATWITAAEPSLGWKRGEFLKALITNREEANTVVIESSLLAGPILKLVAKEDWSGTAEQLLHWVEPMVSDSVRRSPDWPR